MILDKLAREGLSFVEERKRPSEQTHMAAGLLLQGGRCYKAATNQTQINEASLGVAGY